MSEDNQDNPWPGFVDIMSSALLVFVFLVLIQLMVIAGVSMKIGQNAIRHINPEPEASLSESPPQAREPLAQTDHTGAQSIEDTPSRARVVPDQNSITIFYDELETLLSQENTAVLDQWVSEQKAQMIEPRSIRLTSFLNRQELSATTSAFVAYNRMMDLRNQLIKHGLSAENITVRISNTSTESNHVDIQISP